MGKGKGFVRSSESVVGDKRSLHQLSQSNSEGKGEKPVREQAKADVKSGEISHIFSSINGDESCEAFLCAPRGRSPKSIADTGGLAWWWLPNYLGTFRSNLSRSDAVGVVLLSSLSVMLRKAMNMLVHLLRRSWGAQGSIAVTKVLLSNL